MNWKKQDSRHMRPSLYQPFPCLSPPGQYRASFLRRTSPSILHQEVSLFHLLIIRLLVSKKWWKYHPPKPASGISVLILSRQSWEKNMYGERPRLGGQGSFLEPLIALVVLTFSAWIQTNFIIVNTQVMGDDSHYHVPTHWGTQKIDRIVGLGWGTCRSVAGAHLPQRCRFLPTSHLGSRRREAVNNSTLRTLSTFRI